MTTTSESIEPSQVRFKRIGAENRLRILFEFPDPAKRKPISWEVTFDDAMRLLHALQGLQAKYKIPIPPNLRPSGKPNLTLVKMDGES
jgi:hypothetical protein